ncbi:MAG: methyltransferase domain-containing protein [Sedimentisphaerales bacterium]|nr:methyltransferase domain-containing protein [Sedimentisphaerales bacterium]
MMNRFNPSYISPRNDIVELIPPGTKRILDVGCSTGELGANIQRALGAEVTGIEADEDMARVAMTRLHRVIVGDIETIDLSDYFAPGDYDCIVFADVLEHLKDGWQVLARSVDLLEDAGTVIVSIPNVRHYSTIVSLLFRGVWPYRERGIHDRTHLRFFTLQNIRDMLGNAALEVVAVKRHYRIIERPHRYNRYARYVALLCPKELLTFQYLVVARKWRTGNRDDAYWGARGPAIPRRTALISQGASRIV